MPISGSAIATAIAAAKTAQEEAIVAMGQPCAFALRSGETFTVQGVFKFMAEESMTDGINQDKRRLTVSDKDWISKAPAGRNPEKGDQVTVSGRRLAIMEADPVDMGGLRIVWRLKVTG